MPTQRFDEALLKSILERDEATLVGEYEKLNRETKIKFVCKCGIAYEKGLRVIFEHGACCKKCTKVAKSYKSKVSCMERYGVPTPLQNKDVMKKAIETTIEKYGVVHNSLVRSVVEKRKETTKARSDEDNQMIRRKKEETCMTTYGVKNPSQSDEVKEKKIATCISHFGVAYPMQSVEVQKKTVATNLAIYGTERPGQSQELQVKHQHSGYKRKKFVMPSGDIRTYQGYEDSGLRDLLSQGYTEEQIKSNREDIPRIPYDCNGTERAYFPDIFLPHENKIIEVKSTWTYDIDLEKKLKYQEVGVLKLGYIYEIWVYNKKRQRVFVYRGK